MDFEEQLEKAEKLSSPSLVGSSLRSADDSEHNNYIHPEKYKGSSKKSPSKKKNSILNSTLGASLDDLMSEGALLGSEEDFDSYLDESGNVKAERVSYTEEKKSHPLSKETPESAPEAKIGSPSIAAEGAEKEDEEEEEEPEIDATPKPKKKDVSESSSASATAASGAGSIYQNEDYSTPNLSEYQLENQITDHKDLLSSVQSNDPHRLPTRLDYLKSEATAERPKVKKTASFSTPSLIAEDYDSDVSLPVKDGIHAPYFQTDRDGRSSSRSRVAERSSDRSRSRSRSAARPHLARGDSYKSTHDSDPSSYELPSKLDEEEPIKEEEEEEAVKQEEEEGDRRSRMSKPTMGDSLAAIENQERDSSSTARRSLVTTGDYTNFDVDAPESQQQGNDNFTTRSLSSTNYLRSISRSRSRQPGDKGTKPARSHSLLNEKNDSNTDELSSEGALLNDDGYSRINGLDAMVEEVLHLKDGEKKTPIEEVGQKKTPIEEFDQKKTSIEELGQKKTPLEEVGEKKTQNNKIDKENSEIKEIDQGDGEIKGLDVLEKKEIPSEEVKKDVIPKEEELEEEEKNPKKNEEEKEEVSEVDDPKEESKEVESKEVETKEVNPEEELKEVEPEEESKKVESEEESKDDKDYEALETKELINTEVVAENNAEETESKDDTKEVVPEKDVEIKTESIKTKEVVPEKETVTDVKETTSSSKAAPVVVDDDLDDLDISPEEIRKHLESQPVYIFTSLAGGMQIMTRTNRLSTILTGNQVKYTYRDLGTDEEAKKIWRRYSNGKLLPGVVRGDDFIGNFQDIEDANEEYRVREILYETL